LALALARALPLVLVVFKFESPLDLPDPLLNFGEPTTWSKDLEFARESVLDIDNCLVSIREDTGVDNEDKSMWLMLSIPSPTLPSTPASTKAAAEREEAEVEPDDDDDDDDDEEEEEEEEECNNPDSFTVGKFNTLLIASAGNATPFESMSPFAYATPVRLLMLLISISESDRD
jgi:hypothetical protein